MPIDEDIVTRVSEVPGFGSGRDIFAFYQKLVDEAPPGAAIAEVGCFHGRSLAYLALAARKADKGLRVIGSDWMRGQQGDAINAPLGDAVLNSLRKLGVLDADVRLDLLLGSLQAKGVIDDATLVVGGAGTVAVSRGPGDGSLRVTDPVTLLVNKSELAAAWVPDGSLWAVFIDDDHEEPNVRKSFAAWYPKVMAGGVFAGHDYRWDGPNKVCNEWYPQHRVFEWEGTRDIFYFTKD